MRDNINYKIYLLVNRQIGIGFWKNKKGIARFFKIIIRRRTQVMCRYPSQVILLWHNEWNMFIPCSHDDRHLIVIYFQVKISQIFTICGRIGSWYSVLYPIIIGYNQVSFSSMVTYWSPGCYIKGGKATFKLPAAASDSFLILRGMIEFRPKASLLFPNPSKLLPCILRNQSRYIANRRFYIIDRERSLNFQSNTKPKQNLV